MKVNAEHFQHPLTEVKEVDSEPVTNMWGVASFWCYEATCGNAKAAVVVKELAAISNPLVDTDKLLNLAKTNDEAAVRMLTNLVANALEVKVAEAFGA